MTPRTSRATPSQPTGSHTATESAHRTRPATPATTRRPARTTVVAAVLGPLTALLLGAPAMPATAAQAPRDPATVTADLGNTGRGVPIGGDTHGTNTATGTTGSATTRVGGATAATSVNAPGTVQRNAAGRPSVAARRSNAAGSFTFAALCVVGIVALGGGVLLYTARTRRELPTDDTQ